ncbi:flavin monoamine oxidase family protein [Pseudanabaena mucicola]|uniref:FAD-dependent oxidoreductase n=1 Tax=Pseudanabaena mucicola FACHB-723 TaxID=2692860 RepID=A0ABR7ZUR5_9CYAN|nr:FAD-dependent oxidoreductase [Pseudanabaena mucicola]MBD2187733.1 FAD-dependent oxidoreductase [Pseudanabaena mucicola FACHB-723]
MGKRVYIGRSGIPLTRRQFLMALGGLGGAAVLQRGLVSLGLLDNPYAHAQSPRFPTGNIGNGKKVIVIGAGVAGICTAYLLANRGFDVKVFEANNRMGGRSLTVRPGGKMQEVGGEIQTCDFIKSDNAPSPYLNAGPGRIPHHHQTVLKYCRAFKVALEPFIFLSSANRFQSNTLNNGKPVLFRQLQSSLHHEIGEILDKTPGTQLDRALDQVLTEDDFVRMFIDEYSINDLPKNEQRRLLRGVFAGEFGEYTDSLPKPPSRLARLRESFYEESSRFGSDFTNQQPPWAGINEGNPLPIIELEEILRSGLWNGEMFNSLRTEWQNSLLQPVGGMDMLWKAFLEQPVMGNKKVKDLVVVNRPITAITPDAQGVTVSYVDGSDRADFCVSTMTPKRLAAVVRNASEDFKVCLNAFRSVPATKVGFQTKNRFWEVGDDKIYETGKESIYGGISWIKNDYPTELTQAFRQEANGGKRLGTEDFRNLYAQASPEIRKQKWSTLITQVWYPSNGFHGERGVLTGTYNNSRAARALGSLQSKDRIDLALMGGEKLHAGYSNNIRKESALVVAWQNMPYFDGGWDSHSGRKSETKAYYEMLNTRFNPYLNIYCAGDYMSYLPGWMEGSLGSAEIVCDRICEKVKSI